MNSLNNRIEETRPTVGSRSGFTLIELLVVIEIIAILASILFPVFARARENARRSACLSNEHQIGLAIEQYKSDYDSTYPFALGVTATASYTWYYYYLAPYIAGQQISLCPDDPSAWTLGYSYNKDFGYAPGGAYVPSRIGIPVTSCTDGYVTYPYDGINESAVRNPATTIDVTEASMAYSYYTAPVANGGIGDNLTLTYAYMGCLTPYAYESQMAGYYVRADGIVTPNAGIHFGGVNNLYADGHAKWQNVQNIMDPALWCP